MTYLDYTKEQLIQRIEELEEQIADLKELATYWSTTNFVHKNRVREALI